MAIDHPRAHGPGRWILSACLALLALAGGCSSDSIDAGPTASPTQIVIQPGAPGEPNVTLTEIPEVPDLVVEADYEFMRHMLQHHAQALQMTDLVTERSSRDDVALFAERIAISQDEEIDIMQDWLREQGQPVLDLSGDHHGQGQDMPGMLTSTQLEELEAAHGLEFDRLFLRRMYQHHQGAVQMVDDLWTADGAADPFMFQLSKHIDADQRIELDRILGMQVDMGFGDYGSEAGG